MTDDFGRRLEAELSYYEHQLRAGQAATLFEMILLAVRAANAQDSAPALERTDFSSPSNEGGVASGAGVDLADAMCQVRHAVAGNIGWARLAQREAAALLSHIDAQDAKIRRLSGMHPKGCNCGTYRCDGRKPTDVVLTARKEAK